MHTGKGRIWNRFGTFCEGWGEENNGERVGKRKYRE